MANPGHMKFDKRILHRNIESGLLTADEYNKHLSTLPDMEDNAEVIQFNASKANEARRTAEETSGQSDTQGTDLEDAEQDPIS